MIKKIVLLSIIFSIISFSLCADDNGEWYRTQVGSGIGNCGPACVSMSIAWATGSDIAVETVRNYIGYTRIDGATDYLELASALRRWNVPYDIEIVSSLQGLIDLVDRGDLIAVVLVDTAGISINATFGKNYDFSGGHYVVLTEVISNYFVVQDPIPPGIDRRYHIDEVWDSLRDRRIIIVRNYNH